MASDLLSRVKRHFEIRRSLPNVHERHSRGRGLAARTHKLEVEPAGGAAQEGSPEGVIAPHLSGRSSARGRSREGPFSASAGEGAQAEPSGEKRAGGLVALQSERPRGGGGWGPLALPPPSDEPHEEHGVQPPRR